MKKATEKKSKAPKVYVVDVSLHTRVPVLAHSRTEAETHVLALDHLSEVFNGLWVSDDVSAEAVVSRLITKTANAPPRGDKLFMFTDAAEQFMSDNGVDWQSLEVKTALAVIRKHLKNRGDK